MQPRPLTTMPAFPPAASTIRPPPIMAGMVFSARGVTAPLSIAWRTLTASTALRPRSAPLPTAPRYSTARTASVPPTASFPFAKPLRTTHPTTAAWTLMLSELPAPVTIPLRDPSSGKDDTLFAHGSDEDTAWMCTRHPASRNHKGERDDHDRSNEQIRLGREHRVHQLAAQRCRRCCHRRQLLLRLHLRREHRLD